MLVDALDQADGANAKVMAATREPHKDRVGLLPADSWDRSRRHMAGNQ
jgi:hypothetical protein